MKEDFDMKTEQRLREYYVAYYSEMPIPSQVRAQVMSQLTSQPDQGFLRRISNWLFPAHSRLRIAFTSSVLVVVLLSSVLLTVPPVRTWADDTVNDLMTYFGYNGSSPLNPDGKIVSHPSAVANDCTKAANGNMYCVSGDESYIKQDQGQEKLGFNLKAPSYVPGSYIDLQIFHINQKEKWATWIAESKDNGGGCGLQALRLNQRPASLQLKGGSMPIGNAKAHEIMVGSAPGLWVEKVEGAWCRQAGGNRIMRTTNFLSWETENIRYTLYLDSSLNLDEAIKLAESLK